MCWKSGIVCNIEMADKNRIIASIRSNPTDKPWSLMGVYGPPTTIGIEAFWDSVGDYVSQCKLPLVLMGDLNGTLHNNECLNYARDVNPASYSFDLRRMVLRTGLIDLGFKGPKFTWFKRNSTSLNGPCLRRARLDRALECRLTWPNAVVQHLCAVVSDHNLILLDTNGGRFYTRPQFKYEIMWEREPRVFWVVKIAWKLRTHGDPMVNMHRKIKHTKNHLSKWNITQFGMLSTQINEARTRLAEAESNTSINETTHKEAKDAQNEALAREKKLETKIKSYLAEGWG